MNLMALMYISVLRITDVCIFVITDLGNEDQVVAGSASGSELDSVGPGVIKI